MRRESRTRHIFDPSSARKIRFCRIHVAASSRPDVDQESPSILHGVLPDGAKPDTTWLPPYYIRMTQCVATLSIRLATLQCQDSSLPLFAHSDGLVLTTTATVTTLEAAREFLVASLK